jgi:hypothetical protein
METGSSGGREASSAAVDIGATESSTDAAFKVDDGPLERLSREVMAAKLVKLRRNDQTAGGPKP